MLILMTALLTFFIFLIFVDDRMIFMYTDLFSIPLILTGRMKSSVTNYFTYFIY